ncbi:aminoacyl--tRNA ligase-related protein [Streptomyces sp. CG4]|uniref:aminoacyl--tRNA ligase-related protein n=1 Tax=Streptomyces sp. CG4 TaxID=408783 RepID=UPI0034E1A5C5
MLDTGVPGLVAFGSTFETLIDALQRSIGRLAADDRATRIGVPPVISRQLLERLGYVETFPHLLGTVHTYEGDDRQWRELASALRQGESWTQRHELSDVALLPAACYHLYPQLAEAEFTAPAVFDLTGHCYRHERTAEAGRMRSFRMHELIRVDTPASVLGWRDDWIERASGWLRALGLTVAVEPANDPFFGDAGRMMGRMQRADQLKWELVVEVADGLSQAVVSCNCHKDHFSAEFGFRMAEGEAHTSCVAFGLERIALAILHRHGSDRRSWPEELKR